MKISVVTTAFNAEKFIAETIESVLSQKGDFELEYVVIDAKSTDSTLEIVNNYKTLVDSGSYSGRNLGVKMIVLSEEDNGMYEAIAKGFRLITGDVVSYINADDFYLPNAFSCVKDVFSQFADVDWIISRVNDYNEKGQIIKNALPYDFKSEYIQKGAYGEILPVIQQENCFYRKSLLDKINLEEFEKFKFAGDFYLWYNFSKYAELKIINTVLGGFRFNDGQKSANSQAYNAEYEKILNYKPSKIDKAMFKAEKANFKLPQTSILKFNKKIIRYDQGSRTWTFGRDYNFSDCIFLIKNKIQWSLVFLYYVFIYSFLKKN